MRLPNYMLHYTIVFAMLIILMQLYFYAAKKLAIIDIPNERSSHSSLVTRGGGIIIVIASILYFLSSNFVYPYFFFGLIMVSILGFIDDVKGLKMSFRMLIELIAMLLLLYQVYLISDVELWSLPVILLIALGTINAVNFMDGINGILALNGLVMIGAFYFINHTNVFTDDKLLFYIGLGILVFALFNFRKNAKCFAGDVGSLGLGFILVFITLLLIYKTKDPIVILLWAVFGIDSVLTIIERMFKGENIFKAHRQHFYQILSNEYRIPQVWVAILYGLVQALINILVYNQLKSQSINSWIGVYSILTLLGVVYFLTKKSLVKRIG